MRKVPTLLMAPAIALAITACGGSSNTAGTKPANAPPAPSATTSSSAAASGAATTASTNTISGLGPVLVNAQRRTLYTFAPDADKKVTCTGGCAQVWPPMFLPAGKTPVAAGTIKQSLLGSDPDPSGGQVITYAGWPLYTYVSDSAPGQANGQALKLNGGLWY